VVRKNIDQNLIKNPGQTISLHQKAGLVVDKVLHECVFAKSLDNITAVMISFENYEKVSTEMNHSINLQNTKEYNAPMVERRSLEPVPEEYIESEADTPLGLPLVKEKQEKNAVHSSKSPNQLKEGDKLSRT